MARIAGEVVIGRPVDVVFDFVADQRNEPRYNPRMVRADKVTGGPVGRGTVFAQRRAPATAAMIRLISALGSLTSITSRA
jgi:hypothetical protein